jgi:hypothetical protein
MQIDRVGLLGHFLAGDGDPGATKSTARCSGVGDAIANPAVVAAARK